MRKRPPGTKRLRRLTRPLNACPPRATPSELPQEHIPNLPPGYFCGCEPCTDAADLDR